MAKKVYVAVTVRYDETGQVRPLTIQWENGRVYEVDRVLNVCRAASTKVGGCGMRYTCRIEGHETFLYEDENHWFVEGK